MEKTRKVLADNIREFREFLHINQFEFAEDCGLSRETLSLIEREKINTTLDTVDLIACRMGVPMTALLMPRHQYILYPNHTTIENRRYVCYGIGVVKDDVLIDLAADVSTDRGFVEKLVCLFNEQRLSPFHFRDVLEDFLS